MTAADLEAAKTRLRYYLAVLVLERPAESARLLQSVLGWQHVDLDKGRRGSRRDTDARAELASDPALLARLQEMHRLDLQLYEFGVGLMDQQLADLDRQSAV